MPVVLRESQLSCGYADFAAFAVLFTDVGEGLLGVLGLV
jgi:hypothetical protein